MKIYYIKSKKQAGSMAFISSFSSLQKAKIEADKLQVKSVGETENYYYIEEWDKTVVKGLGIDSQVKKAIYMKFNYGWDII